MDGVLSASDQQTLVSSFLEIAVGQTVETARQFLQETSWKLDEAIQLFYSAQKKEEKARQATVESLKALRAELLEKQNDDKLPAFAMYESNSTIPSLPHLLQLFPYPCSRHYLLLALKILRNLCAGHLLNQNAFLDHDGAARVSDLLISVIRDSDPDFEMVRFGLQVLANVALAGEAHQRHVWMHFFPDMFLSIAKLRKQETCDPLSKVVYICCNGSPHMAAQLCSDDGLNIIAEIIRTAASVGYGEDWLKLLLSITCVEDDHFPRLFSKLHRVEDPTFSSEQAFLLRVVSEIVNERVREVSIPKGTALFILELFKRSIANFCSVSGERSELPTGSTIVDVMGYSLTIIRDTMAGESVEDNRAGDIVEALLSSGLIELLLDHLRELEPPTTLKKAITKQNTTCWKPCPYRGFRRDVVAVIGNCAYRRRQVQEEMREREGLLLMLSQCVTDDDNPYLREWGIWCVRNLLEGNRKNQEVVAELEIQGSVDVPELRRLGLRVEVDQTTRRPKLVNVG